MKMRAFPLFLVTLVLFVGLGFVEAVPADVLVTVDGATIETKGPWKVDGRLVRFTLPDGALSSMRLSEVDLEASGAATAEAAAPKPAQDAEPAKKERPAPVLVLTDADIPAGEAPPPEDAATASEATAEGENGGEVDPGRPLQVSQWTWQAAVTDGALWELTGTVTNRGDREAYSLQVYFDAVAVDGDGNPMPDFHIFRPAIVGAEIVPPGESSDFRYIVSGNEAGFESERFAQPQLSFDLRYQLRDAPAEGEAGEDEELSDFDG